MGATRGRLVIGTTVREQLGTSFLPHLGAFREAGWEVHLVAADGPWPSSAPPDVFVHAIQMEKEMAPRSDASALQSWTRLLTELQPRAVIGGSPKGALLSMLAARRVGVPARIYLHRGARWESLTGWRRQVMLQADRLTAKSATSVVAVSPSLASALLREQVVTAPPVILGAGGSKGVDLTRFTPAESAVAQTPTIGYVGRISGDKGLETVLSSWDHLRTSVPAARLVVVGEVDDADPPNPSVIQRLQHDTGIDWLGWRNDVNVIMRSFTVLAFPSAREGLPNVVIEAAASGVPTVGWDVTGVRDAISDEVSGRLVPWGDHEEFARAVTAIATSSDRTRWRSDAREWATRFDQRKVTAAWVELLDAQTTRHVEQRVQEPHQGELEEQPPTHAEALGVAIVTYNSVDTIADCVASLATHATGAHVVIVDNSGQAEQIRAIANSAVARSAGWLASLTVVDAPGNIGYAAGVNLAVTYLPAQCEYLLICNPDVVVTTDPRRLINGLRSSDVTAGRLLGELPNTNRATTWRSELIRAVAGVRFRYQHVPVGVGPRYVDQLAGAYLFQRLDYYLAHPFDERFELYYEDVSYCDTARESGRGVLLQDFVAGTHIGGASSGRVSPTTYRVGRVSRARYLRLRHPRLPQSLLGLPFALEALVRGLTGQAEGSQARKAAWRDVRHELADPGSVRVLADPGAGVHHSGPATEDR